MGLTNGRRPEWGAFVQFVDPRQLTLDLIGTAYNMYPLEHRVNTGVAGHMPTEEFYAVANGQYVLRTKNGVDFSLLANVTATYGGSNWLKQQLTLHDGRHVVFNTGTLAGTSGNIELYSADYSTRTVGSAFSMLPYPIIGFDQQPFTKTVCYAEYGADEVATKSIYRSTNFSTFTPVLTVDAAGSDKEIRHFHCVFADPYTSGKWWAASGDNPEHCHLWESTNDGLSWVKVVTADDRIRATHFDVDATYIYWAEDNPRGGVYRMHKTTKVIDTLVPRGVLSGSLYSMTKTPFGWVVFTEKADTALDPNNSYIYLIDEQFRVHTLWRGPDKLIEFKSRYCGPMTGNIYSYVEPTGRDWYNNRFMVARLTRMGR